MAAPSNNVVFILKWLLGQKSGRACPRCASGGDGRIRHGPINPDGPT